MHSKTVMIIYGTRPEAIKLAPVVLRMQADDTRLTPVVCVTGQHREMLDQVNAWFGIVPDCDLDLMQHGQGLSEFASRALVAVSLVLKNLKPDAILVQGDTTTAMIAAMAAFHERIPVGHVEAGLRTRDLYNPFPEEMNRRIAGVVASYHFAPTEQAVQSLLSEQVDASRVFLVGNTVIDALRFTVGKLDSANGSHSNGKRLILVTAHRRESFGAPLDSICRAIKSIAERNPDVELVYPVHPNPNVREPVARLLEGVPGVHLIEPLRYEQFVQLMSRAYIILTDSGGIQEEATALGKPTLIMRDTTERPEAVDCGTALLVGTETERIVQAAERLLVDGAAYASMSSVKSPFGDGYASERILKILKEHLLRPQSTDVPVHQGEDEMAVASVCHNGFVAGAMSSAKYHKNPPPTQLGT